MSESERTLLMVFSVVAALGLGVLYLILKVLWRIDANSKRETAAYDIRSSCSVVTLRS